MKMYNKAQPLEKYLDTPLECSCGRTHYAPVKDVFIGDGAIEKLPGCVLRHGYKRPFLLCDETTRKIAGERCAQLLRAAGIDGVLHTVTHLGYDEATLGELLIAMPQDCDLVIAVGTGSISDITRYFTYRVGLPCFTVATAAPMDGFAASIGVMNVNHLKTTMQAHNSEVIIGDTAILAAAPYRMTVAGVGDLLGKLSCLNDWRISHLVTGEHYCANIAGLVGSCLSAVKGLAGEIRAKDPQALGEVMRGLVLSGVSISLYGSSRPASGAEHHMSHYWELVFDQLGVSRAMHGEQVAVGTALVLMLCEELRAVTPDFAAARAAARTWSPERWQAEIHRAYGRSAEAILELEADADKNGTAGRLARIDSIEAHWAEIAAELKGLPSSDEFVSYLRYIGSPAAPHDIGVDAVLLKDTFLYCKETRARYTVLSLCADLNLLDVLSDRVIGRLK